MESFQQKLAETAGKLNPRACLTVGKFFLVSDKTLPPRLSLISSCLILGGDGSFGSFLATALLLGTLRVLEDY